MSYERLTLVLTEQEMQELRRLAKQELRKPRDQVAYILRGVLQQNTQSPRNSKSAVEVETTQTGAFATITQ